MIRRGLTLLALLAAALGASLGYRAYQRHLATLPLEWSGTIEARTADVGSRVGGRVKAVLVREGDRVRAGQPLVLLEPGDLDAQRLEAQGQLEQSEASLDKVATGRGKSARSQEIAASRAHLLAEQIAVEKATLDLARSRKLLQGGATTRTDFDDADLALRNAIAQRDAQQAQLDQLLRGTPQDLKSAQGQVDSARGKLAQIQSSLDELIVRAPTDWRIAHGAEELPRSDRKGTAPPRGEEAQAFLEVETLDLRPGDLLAPNAVAAKLLEPDQLYVRIYVPETQLGYVHLSQELPVVVDSFPGTSFKSVVESISAEGEFSPRNLQTADERADQVFAARLRIESGRDVLKAGMAAFARVARRPEVE
jgi:multidrug resistance efflux pump